MRPIIKNPVTPGEMLNEEFLKPLGLTQKKFADHIGVDIKTVNRIIKARTAVTTELRDKIRSGILNKSGVLAESSTRGRYLEGS